LRCRDSTKQMREGTQDGEPETYEHQVFRKPHVVTPLGSPTNFDSLDIPQYCPTCDFLAMANVWRLCDFSVTL
jgi:hypothetical protein